MPRRTDLEDIQEETTNPQDFFDQEIDDGEIEALEAEMQEEEEARKAPEGNYLTILPYVAARKIREVKVINEQGEEQVLQRPVFGYWGDTVSEETEKRFKLGIDVSPLTLYVVWNGAGNPPTYYRNKVDGAQLDPASRNYVKAAKLYEAVTHQKAKRNDELEVFLQETQLRLVVKKFKSGKSGVVGFGLPE